MLTRSATRVQSQTENLSRTLRTRSCSSTPNAMDQDADLADLVPITGGPGDVEDLGSTIYYGPEVSSMLTDEII